MMSMLCALMSCAALFAGCEDSHRAPVIPERLNLIVIVADTLRADHLPFHGYSRDTAPRLSALARESVVFQGHTTHASRTGPSVATLFTGLHARSHGVVNPISHFDAKGTLADENLTLAEILKLEGYQTCAIAANTNISAKFGFSQGFDDYTIYPWKTAESVNGAALEWLAGLDGEREGDPQGRPTATPFFLYLHYIDPHSSYEAPPEFVQMFASPRYEGRVDGAHRQLGRIVMGKLPLEEADVRHLNDLYDAEIRYLDSQLAILLDALDARGLLDTSLIVFVSDHGEELLDHGAALHGFTLFEEQLHVPFLIRHPGMAPRRVTALSRQVDVLPTLLDLLGVPIPSGVQGRSLVAEMKGEQPQGGDELLPVYAQASLRAGRTVVLDAYRRGDWKLIEHRVPARAIELYDLHEDPGEQHDRADTEPEVTARLIAELHAFREALPVRRGVTVKLSDDEVRELKALGYLPDEDSEAADPGE